MAGAVRHRAPQALALTLTPNVCIPPARLLLLLLLVLQQPHRWLTASHFGVRMLPLTLPRCAFGPLRASQAWRKAGATLAAPRAALGAEAARHVHKKQVVLLLQLPLLLQVLPQLPAACCL